MKIKELSPKEIQTNKIYQEWGLTDQEYNMIKDDLLGRLPNYTETGLFAVMWSEHCSYKNSKPVLQKFPTTGPQVLQGPGEGAGIVDIGEGLAVVFKAESHNHPSAVEPYEGAATGVGGIIRDIFSMGARPIAMLNSLRFGELTQPRTRYLFNEVVAGIGGYGNCIGIPTVGGEIQFDACYEGNPLVNAMCVGLIEHEMIQKGQATGVGNTILYVGAKTGRDGIHGATFASEEFTEEGEAQRSAVQVGDPFMEKLLMEACLDVIANHQEALIGIQDMGAAGLVSSSSEMASKAGAGLILHLDDVPQRETGMTPYEMMLSESQERMLLCVKKGCEAEIMAVFEDYDLHAVQIGEVTDDKRYRLYHHGVEVANVPVDALAEQAPVYHKPSQEPARLADFRKQVNKVPAITDLAQTFYQLLQQPTIASKKSVYETFDSKVRTNTVVGPGSDAAVLRIRGTKKALALTMDCNARFIYLDPKIGGQIAVSEAARNIVASGGIPLAITDCLNYGSPENPEVFWELEQSAEGISEACRTLGTPVISGNVSLYNETSGQAIYPTPVIGMVGLIEDVAYTTTQSFKASGDYIYLIGDTQADFNGSELQKMTTGKISGSLRAFDLAQEKRHQDIVSGAIQKGWLHSAHDISEGGLAVAMFESCVEQELGASICVPFAADLLFAETQSRFIVSVAQEYREDFEAAYHENSLCLGRVTANRRLEINTTSDVLDVSIADAKKLWEEAIPCLTKSED